jgi:hypothetical protein
VNVRLAAQLVRPRRRRPARAARLYVKEPCGLCEQARAVLKPYERDGRLQVTTVDIEAEAELFRRYCFSVPVLEIESGAELPWPFGKAEVERLLG